MIARTETNAAPRCPLHVGVAMRTLEVKLPYFVVAEEEAAGWHMRKIWKCPVEGCRYVHVYELSDEDLAEKKERRRCPTCGEATDASADQRMHGNAVCHSCRRKYNRARQEEREGRRRSWHAGMKGRPYTRALPAAGRLTGWQRTAQARKGAVL